jgi:hypothetical protein
LRVNEVQKIVHEAAFIAVQEVFSLDIVPEAKRLSPVSPDNPKIVGSKYKDTGHNRRSIDATVYDSPEGPRAELSTSSGYGAWLEIGTRLMAARPYLYPAFMKFIGKLGEIISAKLKALNA